MLSRRGQPKAFDALLDLAGKFRGQTRVHALDLLAQTHPAIRRSRSCSSIRCSRAAATRRSTRRRVLGRIGTEDARQALIAALTGKDPQLAAAAAGRRSASPG